MKICNRCRVSRKADEYNYKNQSKGIRQKVCRICTRAAGRRHYVENKDYYLSKARIRNKKRRLIIRKYIWNYLKSHPCIDCGVNDPIVLEFDHVTNKSMSITHAASNVVSMKTLKEEIKKCVVRCANCHRRKTSYQLNWYKE